MTRAFRVIDTGVREGRSNIAFDQALIDLHRQGAIPDTIRFLQFQPSALVGRHQSLSREIRVDYCLANGIGLVRRITGGGSLYMDEGQFGFELVFHRKTLECASLTEISKAICEAAAEGLRTLGVDARFRPRNDIEVGGRKISGTGGFFDGDTIFFQGTVLVDMDSAKMLAALNVPQDKLAKRAFGSAAQRVVTLRELLGPAAPSLPDVKIAMLNGFAEKLRIQADWGSITAAEEAAAQQLLADEIGADEFVFDVDDQLEASFLAASATGVGGTISAYVRVNDHHIRDVLIRGDFLITPPGKMLDLEASLRGIRLEDVETHVEAFFAKAGVEMLSAEPSRFSEVIQAAIASRPSAPL